MKKPNKFRQIGEKVTVYATVEFAYNDKSERVQFRTELEIPQVGVITGGTYKMLGTYSSANSRIDYYGDDDYEPAYLSVSETKFIYTVKFGLMNKDVYVLPNDVLTNFNIIPLPIKYVSKFSYNQSKKFSDDMKDIMKNWPRDEKGRWKKELTDHNVTN